MMAFASYCCLGATTTSSTESSRCGFGQEANPLADACQQVRIDLRQHAIAQACTTVTPPLLAGRIASPAVYLGQSRIPGLVVWPCRSRCTEVVGVVKACRVVEVVGPYPRSRHSSARPTVRQGGTAHEHLGPGWPIAVPGEVGDFLCQDRVGDPGVVHIHANLSQVIAAGDRGNGGARNALGEAVHEKPPHRHIDALVVQGCEAR